jgi:hypothetical protein
MKQFSSHFSESYLVEGGMTTDDLFKRKNKTSFVDRVNSGELVSLSGDTISIKDRAGWTDLSADISNASEVSDVTDLAKRVKSTLGVPFTQIDKIANGFSTLTGKDPTGEDWEAGIAVGLDKLAGKKWNESEEWDRFGKYWGAWEDQAMATAEAFRKELGIQELKQTGSSRATLSKVWKGKNKTPKTDLLGGKERISLKKAGGSQLMSASKEEAISTVEAAMSTFCITPKGKNEFAVLLKSFEDNLVKLSAKGQVSALRKNPEMAAEIEIADAKTASINTDIEKYINSSLGFKSHFCWEAATGHTKFGQDTWPTATLIVTFKGTGGIDSHLRLDTPEKAGKYLAKGNNFYVSFKSSGSSAPYLSLRSKNIAKSKLMDDHIPSFAEIIAEETIGSGLYLTEDLMQLDEYQMLNKLKKGAKAVSTTVVNAAKKALAAIQKRLSQAFNMIKKLGAKAWSALLKFFGLEVGKVTIRGGGKYPLL